MARMIILACAALGLVGCQPTAVQTEVSTEPKVVAASDIEAGRYLVKVASCNHCHTPGFSESGGRLAEASWLKGSSDGFEGPWGTTYAHNLRLSAAGMTEDAWVQMLSTREHAPPMPWDSVRALNDADKRAIYRYIRSLEGDPGQPAPTATPPQRDPPAS